MLMVIHSAVLSCGNGVAMGLPGAIPLRHPMPAGIMSRGRGAPSMGVTLENSGTNQRFSLRIMVEKPWSWPAALSRWKPCGSSAPSMQLVRDLVQGLYESLSVVTTRQWPHNECSTLSTNRSQ